MTYDFAIIGSGFGGSVSALRLAEKGYRVVVVEKGKRFAPGDFPDDNRDTKRWMWMPALGLHGIFQMSFFQHVTVLHGVGVGGGSLTYANTLPTPTESFFASPSWSHLADWKAELHPHYATARRMLGAAPNPRETAGDRVLRTIARNMGREHHHKPTEVSVFFGKPGARVPDPYFGGKGPERVGCTFCGACMTGCKVGAKNTLDRNYLYLAEGLGAEIRAEREVTAVRPRRAGGYRVELRPSLSRGGQEVIEASNVVFAGGVLGTIPLLLRMREDTDGLPRLSAQLGRMVRTNSEALFGVTAPGSPDDFSDGVAITSILHTDEHSHIEPVRYGHGSDFFRYMVLPHAPGATAVGRAASALLSLARQPRRWLRMYATPRAEFAERTAILLYMRTVDGTLSLELGRSAFTGFRRGLVTRLEDHASAPKAFMPEATELANEFSRQIGGVPGTMLTETLLGSPSTAHILGGACMGASPDEGVIDHRHRVFGYDGLYVIDGAAMSANPGVNPSLTITAMAERAMSYIPARA